MQLIDAVNVTLKALGESLITDINTSNPSAGLAKSSLAIQRRGALATGWWFNTIERIYTPSALGKINVPYNQLSVYGTDGSKYGVRNSLLYNLVEQTSVFTETVTLRIMIDVEFEDLPEYIAQYLAYSVAAETYMNDLGKDNNYVELQAKASEYKSLAFRENLRNEQYNSASLRQSSRIRRGFYI